MGTLMAFRTAIIRTWVRWEDVDDPFFDFPDGLEILSRLFTKDSLVKTLHWREGFKSNPIATFQSRMVFRSQCLLGEFD